MDTLSQAITAHIGAVIGTLLIVLAVMGSVRYAAGRYRKVPPSKVLVVYGRKHRMKMLQPDGTESDATFGFHVVTGGGKLIVPVLEACAELDLRARGIEFTVENIPTRDGVRVNAAGIATVHISREQLHLISAAQNFEDKKDSDIDELLTKIMSGQLRAILGKMSIEALIGERDKLNQNVLEVAETELLKLGVKIDILTIQSITDNQGYIEALGKKRTAEVKRDAAVGEAQAERERMEKTSEAIRAGKEAELANLARVAEAERDLNTKKAQYEAEVHAAQAKSAQAGPLAEAEALKAVKLARVAVETTETEARIALALQEAAYREKQLVTEKIRPAEAAREAAIIAAQASKQTAIIEAEASKQTAIIQAEAAFAAAEKNADAVRIKAEAEASATAKKGQGEAEATKAKLVAEADGQKARLLAAAEGEKARLLAEAAGQEATLLAEARGKRELAEALAKLDSTGRLLQILDAAPRVAESIGDALAKALGPQGLANVFGQIAAPLGNVDSIRILDLGAGGNGSNPLSRLTGLAPKVVFDFVAQAQSLGFGPMLEKLGLSPGLLKELDLAETHPNNGVGA
ncbi:MAG TPA: SPFH domain-containing protein [Bryobacteraceae bacterium]|nr:SPFH domain-containing protein [Bryobacteraceae bacterium]